MRQAKRDRGHHLWASYRALPPAHPHRCAECGRGDVRLYREGGMFFREGDARCNACLESTDWKVPLITDPVGYGVWGYSSVPERDCDRFFAAPEADPRRPTYQRNGCWS